MPFIMSLSTDIVAIVNVYFIIWHVWENVLQYKWHAKPQKVQWVTHCSGSACKLTADVKKKSLHNGILVSILPKWWRSERAGIILISHRKPHGFISVGPSIVKESKLLKQDRLDQGLFPGLRVHIYILMGFSQTIIRYVAWLFIDPSLHYET